MTRVFIVIVFSTAPWFLRALGAAIFQIKIIRTVESIGRS